MLALCRVAKSHAAHANGETIRLVFPKARCCIPNPLSRLLYMVSERKTQTVQPLQPLFGTVNFF